MVTALPEAAGVLDPGEVPVRVEARHRRPGGGGGGDMGKRESLGKEGAQRDKGCASCAGHAVGGGASATLPWRRRGARRQGRGGVGGGRVREAEKRGRLARAGGGLKQRTSTGAAASGARGRGAALCGGCWGWRGTEGWRSRHFSSVRRVVWATQEHLMVPITRSRW